VTQRGEADVKAAMRAQGSRDRSNLLRRCQSGDRGVGCASVPLCTLSRVMDEVTDDREGLIRLVAEHAMSGV